MTMDESSIVLFKPKLRWILHQEPANVNAVVKLHSNKKQKSILFMNNFDKTIHTSKYQS